MRVHKQQRTHAPVSQSFYRSSDTEESLCSRVVSVDDQTAAPPSAERAKGDLPPLSLLSKETNLGSLFVAAANTHHR